MLAANPLRMNYEKKYQEIIAAYNQDKDRATVEGVVRRNRRKFRHPKSSPASISSKSIILPPLWNV
jgi:hypothetical protein